MKDTLKDKYMTVWEGYIGAGKEEYKNYANACVINYYNTLVKTMRRTLKLTQITSDNTLMQRPYAI